MKVFALTAAVFLGIVSPLLPNISAQEVLFSRQESASAALPEVGTTFTAKTDVGTEETGQVLYRSNISGHNLVALATDTGTARPTQDFRIYFQQLGGYHLALSVPSITGRAFRCEEAEGVLRVFLVTKYPTAAEPTPAPKTTLTYEQPFLIIDLPELVKAFQ